MELLSYNVRQLGGKPKWKANGQVVLKEEI